MDVVAGKDVVWKATAGGGLAVVSGGGMVSGD